MQTPSDVIHHEELVEKLDIKRIRQGNEAEFHKLFQLLYPRLMALACRFVTRFVAEDIVQNVFEKYWLQKEKLQIHSLPSFLYRCTQNECLNYLKHQDVAHNYELEIRLAEERIAFQREYSDENETLDKLLEKDLKALFCQALDHLSPKCRQAFELSFFRGMTYKEIAEHLSVSPRTIEEHVQKAIHSLRHDLGRILYTLYILSSQL